MWQLIFAELNSLGLYYSGVAWCIFIFWMGIDLIFKLSYPFVYCLLSISLLCVTLCPMLNNLNLQSLTSVQICDQWWSRHQPPTSVKPACKFQQLGIVPSTIHPSPRFSLCHPNSRVKYSTLVTDFQSKPFFTNILVFQELIRSSQVR